MNIAQKEAGQTGYWLAVIREGKISSGAEVSKLEGTAIELKKICREIIRRSRARK